MWFKNLLCELGLHRWKYSDFKEHRYYIEEKRTCTHCGQEEECLDVNDTPDGTFVTKQGSLPKK